MEAGEDLLEIQTELQTVKKALRTNGSHLGMSGETLQRYFLQLNEKENLLLSAQLKKMPSAEASPAAMLDVKSHGSYSLPTPAASATNGSAAAKSGEPVQPARELPAGDVQAFDRADIAAVIKHMTDYEASASESSKALRALSSLAYDSAVKVAEAPGALEQVLRLLALHPSEDLVQLNGIRSMCNMAYNTTTALQRLSSPEVFSALVSALARKPDHREIGAKASEAVARIVAAEISPEATDGDNGKPAAEPSSSPMSSLFQVACMQSEAAGQGTVVKLVASLVQNEVVKSAIVAQKFTAEAAAAKGMPYPAADCWLSTAKQLAMSDIPELAEAFIDCSTIKVAIDVMAHSLQHGSTQLVGIEALSGLVGTRWAGLQAFAELKGIERIEAAMKNHPDEAVLQTKGIRALASGIGWPQDIQKQSGFKGREGVALTKLAMSKHGDNLELVLAGLENLPKYMDKVKDCSKDCMAEMKENGGAGLIKAIMAKYTDSSKAAEKEKPAYQKVKTTCVQILETLGEKSTLAGESAN